MVMLKVSPWKGVIRFGKRGKLSPQYIGPFKIVERIGSLCLQAGVLPVEIMGRRSEATQAKSNYYCFHCSMDFPDEIGSVVDILKKPFPLCPPFIAIMSIEAIGFMAHSSKG
ncbi:hypothetical protein Tco_1337888 [Tanacetum coccineum]